MKRVRLRKDGLDIVEDIDGLLARCTSAASYSMSYDNEREMRDKLDYLITVLGGVISHLIETGMTREQLVKILDSYGALSGVETVELHDDSNEERPTK